MTKLLWFTRTVHNHSKKQLCPAFDKKCLKCGNLSHLAAKCRSKKRDNNPTSVRAVNSYSEPEVFYANMISAVDLDDSQLITLKLESGNYLRFQPDTGAQCNFILVSLSRKATKDYRLERVTPANTQLSAYGGSKLQVVGNLRITVWHDDFKCQLDCKLVDNNTIRPLLGRKACVGMRIIKYTDYDQLNKPRTGSAPVYSLEKPNVTKATQGPITRETLTKNYPQVFSEGVGKLAGEYHIRIDSTTDPIQQAPHRVPVALRRKVKEALEDLEQQEVIAPVTSPTAWISSMVTVLKKNGKLHICLDPKDLNRAVQREHYPLPTIEDIATRLHGAKVFTKLDVWNGFWHVALDEDSSFLTTFHTPFGRYHWRRLPFGISSAPEVFQRKMHERIEGLSGIEVVVIGCGSTLEEATVDHDKVLMAFLEHCKEQGVKLNMDKLNLRKTEVPFIGHIATDYALTQARSRRSAKCQLQQTKLESRQSLSAVSQQVPPSTVRYYKAYGRGDTERHTVDLGNSSRSVIRSTEESCNVNPSPALLQPPGGSHTPM